MLRVLALVLLISLAVAAPAAEPTPNAVTYRDAIYLSVDQVAELLQGETSFLPRAGAVQVRAGDKEWRFSNGGDRLILPDGTERVLKRPILVLEGRHFFPLQECAGAFGCTVQQKPRPSVAAAGRKVEIRARAVGSPYQRHDVGELQVLHEVVTVRESVRGLRSLRLNDAANLAVGTNLLLRRKVMLDGVSYLLATDCGSIAESLLIEEKPARTRFAAGKLDGTDWSRWRAWFDEEAAKEAALRHGNRPQLTKSVALTIDLCWSLRAYETRLFQSLRESARQAKRPVHPVIFVSGRWLEQHPVEMHDLLQLGLEPGVEITWGLHSWDHPKSGGFMNEYPPDKLRADTLRLERLLLEWGIVPTVYYRFPGLIHDRLRLREILALDLLPIDCDSWLALVREKDRSPFYHQVRDGSVILVHGNGNEPAGIEAWERWLNSHRDWELAPLHRFLPGR